MTETYHVIWLLSIYCIEAFTVASFPLSRNIGEKQNEYDN